MIELSGVSKTFNAGKPNRFTALQAIDLTLAPGRVAVFKGPSGSGKTTLLGIIGCMARPTTGRLRIGGREVTRLPERFLAKIRRESFGFVFQSFNLVSGVSVLENVMLPGYPADVSLARIRQRALSLLEDLGIGSKAHEPVQSLSGGEQQRVAIARALVKDPVLLAGDEPTGNLDESTSIEVIDLLRRLNQEQGLTIILATHDPTLAGHGARVLSLHDGVLREGYRRKADAV